MLMRQQVFSFSHADRSNASKVNPAAIKVCRLYALTAMGLPTPDTQGTVKLLLVEQLSALSTPFQPAHRAYIET